MTTASKEFSANDVSEAIAKAVTHFHLPQEKLKIEVLATGSTGIFGFRRKQAKIRVTPHDDARKSMPAPTSKKPRRPRDQAAAERQKTQQQPVMADDKAIEVIQQETKDLLAHMTIEADLSITQDDAVRIHITGADENLLIGTDGKTLDSFQYLLRKIVSRRLGEKLALNVDAGGYRKKRAEELGVTALKLAEQALETGKTQAIPSLNPQERRIVHMAIRDNAKIRTKSIGNGLFKKILIFPHGQKPSSRPRRGRQRGRRKQNS